MAVEERDYLEFLPLFPEEDEETIRDRWDTWANEGKAVDAPDWTDTREGAFFHLLTTPGVREASRLYDLMGTDVPASAHPLWAWGDYLDDHAEVQDVDRLAAVVAQAVVRFTGDAGTVIPFGTAVGVEPVSDEDEPVEYETTEEGVIPGVAPFQVDVAVVARTAGSKGNVGAGAITQLLSVIPGVTVTNPAKATGGADTETDEELRSRLMDEYVGKGGGRQFDYVRLARAYGNGIARVTVIPVWDGPGTVKVIILDVNGDPLPAEVVDGLQAFLDPIVQQGSGEAPIGAAVTVETAAALDVTLEAVVEFEPGYSLDGEGGTLPLRSTIEDRMRSYTEAVPPGGEIVLAQEAGRVATVPGVHDVSGVEINGAAANLAVDDDPAQAPQVTAITLTPAP